MATESVTSRDAKSNPGGMIDNSPAFKCGVPVVNGPSPEGTAEGCVRYVMQSSLFSRRYATCRIPSTDPGIEMPGYFQAPRWGAKRPLPVLFLNLTRTRWVGTRPTRLRNLLVAAPGRPPAPRFHVETPPQRRRLKLKNGKETLPLPKLSGERFPSGPFPRGNGPATAPPSHGKPSATSSTVSPSQTRRFHVETGPKHQSKFLASQEELCH